MKIPDKVKIGGLIYTVEQTESISLGQDYYGETDYTNLKMSIRPCNTSRMEAVFIHEILHGIHDILGYSKQDEKKIEELANALYALIVDNPEMFSAGGD